MGLMVYPNGYKEGKNTHLSIFVSLVKGDFDKHLTWPFRGEVIVKLVDRYQDRHNIKKLSFDDSCSIKWRERPFESEVVGGIGFCLYQDHKHLSNYLESDCLKFEITQVNMF